MEPVAEANCLQRAYMKSAADAIDLGSTDEGLGGVPTVALVGGSRGVEYGRHDRFWQELAWPAEGREYISEHTPLWLVM